MHGIPYALAARPIHMYGVSLRRGSWRSPRGPIHKTQQFRCQLDNIDRRVLTTNPLLHSYREYKLIDPYINIVTVLSRRNNGSASSA
jgi:hypothetical protein